MSEKYVPTHHLRWGFYSNVSGGVLQQWWCVPSMPKVGIWKDLPDVPIGSNEPPVTSQDKGE